MRKRKSLLWVLEIMLLLIGMFGCGGGGREEDGREIVLQGQVLTTNVSLSRQKQLVPLPKAIVRALNPSNRQELASSSTDENGGFIVRFPIPDTTLVELEAIGKSASQKDIVMKALVAARSSKVGINPLETLTVVALNNSGAFLPALPTELIHQVRNRIQNSQQIDINQVDFTDPAQVQSAAQQAIGRMLIVTSIPNGARVFLGVGTQQSSGITPLLLEPPQSDSVVVRVELQSGALKTTLVKSISVPSKGLKAIHFNFQPSITTVNQNQPLIPGNFVEIEGMNFGSIGETIKVQIGAFLVDGTVISVNSPDQNGNIPTKAQFRVPSNLSPGFVSISVRNAALKSEPVQVAVQSISQGQFTLSSSVFKDGDAIPPSYTRLGSNLSPPLSWTGAPQGTQSFVIVCVDLDANNFVHWLIYDIPNTTTSLPEGLPKVAEPFTNVKQGVNGFGQLGYDGPEPPIGDQRVHHYLFRIYALSVRTLGLPAGASLAQVQQAMEGRILGTASLVGIFRRP